MAQPNRIVIDDVEYVRADSLSSPAVNAEGLEYVVIRSKDSGVHAGYLKEQDGVDVILVNTRRIYYWSGASTLSELATKGAANPNDCKFPAEIPEIRVFGICEVIPCTEEARKSIVSVPEWTQH